LQCVFQETEATLLCAPFVCVCVCLLASSEPSGNKLCDTPKSLSSPPTLHHVQIQAYCGFT